MQSSILAKRAWLLVFIAIAGFYLWGLGSLPLVGPDEPRYAEVAREMFARRDLITPTLGGLPWFEKPPLLYWLMMISYRLLGVNEYAARMGPALCGLITALIIYLIGSTIDEPRRERHANSNAAGAGPWSALVWLSSLGAIVFSRAASFDVLLTATVSGAMACFVVSEIRGRAGRLQWWLAGFYLCAALSLLAKGLVGFVIIFGVIGCYFILRREWPRKAFLISLGWGVPLSIAVASVWYGPMIAKHGWTFIDQFIIQHHFARFVSNKYHHRAPFYFYLPVLIGLALPWTVVLCASVISSRGWNWRGQAPLDRVRVFALAWLIVPVIFFSFSESKLPGYILPALPAVAVLVGERISCFVREARGEKVLRLTGSFLIVVSATAIWYTHRNAEVRLATLIIAALPLIVIAAVAMARPQFRTPLFVLIPIAALATATICLEFAAPVVAKHESVKEEFTAAAQRGYSNTPVIQLEILERSAEFYAAGRLNYGRDGEPVILETMPQVLDAVRQDDGVVVCVVPADLATQLVKSQQANSEFISDNGRVALVIVRAK